MIIIPDIHGRSFWREAIEKVKEDEEIVFLGDYVDPYDWEGFTREDAIKDLEDVIELKKAGPDKITILLGNHDFQYVDLENDFRSRYDYKNAPKIHGLFLENIELFDMAKIQGKYLFSHSGILKPWVEIDAKPVLGENPKIEEIPGILNRALHKDPLSLSQILLCASRYRGGWSKAGSCVWGDVREFAYEDPEVYQYPGVYQIFGHSQQTKDPVIMENWACLDCRKTFRLENNKIEVL